MSKDDSQDLRKNLGKDSKSEAESRDLTQNNSSNHFSGNGSCGWIRTNHVDTQQQTVTKQHSAIHSPNLQPADGIIALMGLFIEPTAHRDHGNRAHRQGHN
ncbi:MAG TPA: hypothetical protein EYG40_02565 [Verrucomicrobia bacterium]|nr:hypothetical protein [Verrucomicrobiales bacterium]HIL53902.1 hypothetical protein [Verrucomicrobiota bacterium]